MLAPRKVEMILKAARKTSDNSRMMVYRAAVNDVQASRVLGIELEAFRSWRRRKGLVAKTGAGRPKKRKNIKKTG